MLDLRTANILNYGNYSTQKNITYLGIYGDSYDRFLIRVRELFTATTIIYNNLSNLSDLNQITLIASRHYTSINTIKLEKLINLFSIVTNFISLKQIISFGGVESGKGYFQITIISSGIKPYRLYIRSPAYAHLQLLATLATGHALADITTLLGSLDIVFGEVDR
jgi:NADH-quinone oxidoreductase subunit D